MKESGQMFELTFGICKTRMCLYCIFFEACEWIICFAMLPKMRQHKVRVVIFHVEKLAFVDAPEDDDDDYSSSDKHTHTQSSFDNMINIVQCVF